MFENIKGTDLPWSGPRRIQAPLMAAWDRDQGSKEAADGAGRHTGFPDVFERTRFLPETIAQGRYKKRPTGEVDLFCS